MPSTANDPGYFADKREVLFAGSADFKHAVVEAVRAAPAGATPVDAVITALAEAGTGLTNRGNPSACASGSSRPRTSSASAS